MINILRSVDIVEINSICWDYNIKNYRINQDCTIDVEGDVNLYSKKLTKLPLNFNKVIGNFVCSNNLLTTLEGSPKEIVGSFSCRYNKLTTLDFMPTVSLNINCSNNLLTSLEGCPEVVNGDFTLNDNKLTSLEFFPTQVNSNILYNYNKLPIKFTDLIFKLKNNEFRIFCKYQQVMGIWNDGIYDHDQALILFDEIKDGLL